MYRPVSRTSYPTIETVVGVPPLHEALPVRAAEVQRRLEPLEARFLLWKATGDPAHLAEAHRLLRHLRDHAPEDCRETMIENVPLHRDIMAAWEEHCEGAK